jgi:hypothetical protein
MLYGLIWKFDYNYLLWKSELKGDDTMILWGRRRRDGKWDCKRHGAGGGYCAAVFFILDTWKIIKCSWHIV